MQTVRSRRGDTTDKRLTGGIIHVDKVQREGLEVGEGGGGVY